VSAVDRVAVVTGGGRGIGRACVERLVQDGATVVAVDLGNGADTIAAESPPGTCTAMACEVTDPDQVADLAAAVHERFGRCDILINNVGIYPFWPFDTMRYEDFRRVMTVNVESVFLMSKAFGPGMRDRGWGRIVNMGSAIALSQAREFLAYMTSKGAVHALTRALANELGSGGVTVNAIAPSIIGTEGNHSRAGDVAGMSFEDEQALMISLQTLKRSQEPADVANAVAFLVSEEAGFMTGQIVHVDGGMTRTGA